MPFSSRPVHEVKANLFRVLGHPARVRILELLRDGEHSVGQLQAELELDSSGTSQHLAALRAIQYLQRYALSQHGDAAIGVLLHAGNIGVGIQSQ